MCRRAIDIEIVLFDILAVIAFAIGQAEQPLLQDRVGAIPERQCKAKTLLVIADAGQPVLAPAIGAGACLIVAEIVPCRAGGAIILTNRPPLPLAEIGSPAPPGELDRCEPLPDDSVQRP